MRYAFLLALCCATTFALFTWPVAASAQAGTNRPDSPGGLLEGSIAQSIETLQQQLNQDPQNDTRRFALGIAQSLRAVEKLAASLHEHGLRAPGAAREVPLLRLPVPVNPQPRETSIEDVDRMIAQFVSDLQIAQKTLEMVDDPAVSLPVRIGMIRPDLNGDAPDGQSALWEIGSMAQLRISKEQAEQFTINFDLGDVRWLEGYTHLLCAIGNMYLSHDKQALFDVCGHLFFSKPKASGAFLADAPSVWEIGEGVDIVDYIALVHMLRLPVKDAPRMEMARQDLLATLRCSRASWDAILKETDDQSEWLPNPRQTNVITQRIQITPDVINGWLAFVDECEAALEGRKLLPFWRGKPGQGVNLKRVFTEPKQFDLVLWVQGSAAAPYLENGPTTTAESIRRLEQLLGGEFFTFSLWVN